MDRLNILVDVMEKSLEKDGDTNLKISDMIKIINNIINYDEKIKVNNKIIR